MRQGHPSSGGAGLFLQVLTLRCFPFRSRPRTQITGSGVGCASAPPRPPRNGVGAAGGPGECSHLQDWRKRHCIPQCIISRVRALRPPLAQKVITVLISKLFEWI